MLVAPFKQFYSDCTELNWSHLGKKCAYITKVTLLTGTGAYALCKGASEEIWFKPLFFIGLAIGYHDLLQLSYRDRLYAEAFYEKWRQLKQITPMSTEHSQAVVELTNDLFYGDVHDKVEQIQAVETTPLVKIQAGDRLYKALFPHPPSIPSERMEGMISRFLYQDLIRGSGFPAPEEVADDSS